MFFLPLADVPTTRKVFHRSHVASGQYLALPHWLLFRAEKKGDPVLETARVWPKRALRPIPSNDAASGNALPKNIGG
jgi:hypothetical protein